MPLEICAKKYLDNFLHKIVLHMVNYGKFEFEPDQLFVPASTLEVTAPPYTMLARFQFCLRGKTFYNTQPIKGLFDLSH